MNVIIATFSTFAVLRLMVLLAERSSGAVTKKGHLMRYHSFSIGVGVFFSLGALVVFALLLVLVEGNREPTALQNGAVAFAIVICPATWFTVRACRTAVLVFPNGLLRLVPGGRRKVLWAEVDRVYFDAFAGRYRIATRKGFSLVVSLFMTGQREFAVEVLRNVPASKLDCETRLRKLTVD